MPGVTHDFESKVDRVTHVLEPRRAARPQLRSLHHASVQLNHPVEVEAGADAGVEERLVLHKANRGQHGLEGTAAYRAPAGVARALDGRLPERQLGFRYRAGSAVDDERRPGRGYSACR